jgi:hypothetical protein
VNEFLHPVNHSGLELTIPGIITPRGGAFVQKPVYSSA